MILTHASIDEFLRSLSVQGAQENTVRAYKADLMGLLEYQSMVPPQESLEVLAATYLTENRSTWKQATTARKLASFRAFGRFLGNPTFLANYKSPKVPKGIAHPIPEGVSGILKMIDEANLPHQKALIAMIGLLGLRVSEARSVTRESFIVRGEDVWLRVRGKGDKTRDVPVSDGVAAILSVAVLTAPPGQPIVPLSDRVARKAFKSIGKRVGLDVASHDGRMTFGTHTYHESGGDLRTVQELLGHASSATTEGYTHVSEARKREVAKII